MLKQTLTIVALLVLAATIAACGGGTEPQAVVTVTATPTPTYSPTPTPDPDPTESFDALERKNFSFIEKNYALLYEKTEDLRLSIEGDDITDLELLADFTGASGNLLRVGKKWFRLDWSSGETYDLEHAFDKYLRATKSYYINWMSLLMGDGDFDQQCVNILKAEENIEGEVEPKTVPLLAYWGSSNEYSFEPGARFGCVCFEGRQA